MQSRCIAGRSLCCQRSASSPSYGLGIVPPSVGLCRLRSNCVSTDGELCGGQPVLLIAGAMRNQEGTWLVLLRRSVERIRPTSHRDVPHLLQRPEMLDPKLALRDTSDGRDADTRL